MEMKRLGGRKKNSPTCAQKTGQNKKKEKKKGQQP